MKQLATITQTGSEAIYPSTFSMTRIPDSAILLGSAPGQDVYPSTDLFHRSTRSQYISMSKQQYERRMEIEACQDIFKLQILDAIAIESYQHSEVVLLECCRSDMLSRTLFLLSLMFLGAVTPISCQFRQL